MILRSELRSQLPRLAWAATISKNEPVVLVVHGSWVEVREDAFVEGAWDGPFEAFRFDEAMMLVGSGARITPDGITFAGHSDLHERLYAIRRDGAVHISPSLALALAVSGESLDPDERHYYLSFVDAYRAGIRYPRKRIRLASGRWADMHDVCNLHVTPDLAMSRVEKPWPPTPHGYAAYHSLMQDTLTRVLRNAADPARRQVFRPVCMISRGYDSVAVAALASKAGCTEAVTYHESGTEDGVASDDGSEIGRVLGYGTTVYRRPERLIDSDGQDEFYMEPWGVDCDVVPMAPQLSGAILLSGRSTSGWEVGNGPRWGLPGNSGLRDLQRPIGYTPGCALTDFRMRVGFLHLAVPGIGAIHAPALHRLTESDEMRPWRLGVRYDKPIPRRIAEEAGVSRHLFGMVKMGGQKRPRPSRSFVARLWRRTHAVKNWGPMRVLIFKTLGNRLHPRWRTGSFEVQASAAKVVERYRQALSA